MHQQLDYSTEQNQTPLLGTCAGLHPWIQPMQLHMIVSLLCRALNNTGFPGSWEDHSFTNLSGQFTGHWLSATARILANRGALFQAPLQPVRW